VEVTALTNGIQVRFFLYHRAIGECLSSFQRLYGHLGVGGLLKSSSDRGGRTHQVLALGGDLGWRCIKKTHCEENRNKASISEWARETRLSGKAAVGFLDASCLLRVFIPPYLGGNNVHFACGDPSAIYCRAVLFQPVVGRILFLRHIYNKKIYK